MSEKRERSGGGVSARQTDRERGREGKGSKEGGGGRQAKCAQYSFKLTEAVCVLVYTSLCYSRSPPHPLAFSLSLSLSRSLSLSLSIQTVCSFQQQDEEDTGERLGRKKKGEPV